jgi:hypothetical protein
MFYFGGSGSCSYVSGNFLCHYLGQQAAGSVFQTEGCFQ